MPQPQQGQISIATETAGQAAVGTEETVEELEEEEEGRSEDDYEDDDDDETRAGLGIVETIVPKKETVVPSLSTLVEDRFQQITRTHVHKGDAEMNQFLPSLYRPSSYSFSSIFAFCKGNLKNSFFLKKNRMWESVVDRVIHLQLTNGKAGPAG